MERVFAYDTYLLDINSVESSAEALAIRDISQRTLLRLSQSRCPHRLRVATSLAGGLSASRVAPLDAGGAGDRCVARARARQADAERCASTAPMQPHTTQSPLHISRHRTHRTAHHSNSRGGKPNPKQRFSISSHCGWSAAERGPHAARGKPRPPRKLFTKPILLLPWETASQTLRRA
jgi:hypothetical protein